MTTLAPAATTLRAAASAPAALHWSSAVMMRTALPSAAVPPGQMFATASSTPVRTAAAGLPGGSAEPTAAIMKSARLALALPIASQRATTPTRPAEIAIRSMQTLRGSPEGCLQFSYRANIDVSRGRSILHVGDLAVGALLPGVDDVVRARDVALVVEAKLADHGLELLARAGRLGDL